jgi:hypothetical protein
MYQLILLKNAKKIILFVFLPPNSTHLCQPLDVAVFRPMKIAWRKSVFPGLLKNLLLRLHPNLSSNITSGFAASGIIPVDSQRVLSKILGKPISVNNNA